MPTKVRDRLETQLEYYNLSRTKSKSLKTCNLQYEQWTVIHNIVSGQGEGSKGVKSALSLKIYRV